ncbi:MAG: hypothetical protein ACF8PN_00300 [Phycisphaerales bacterium]
MTTSEERLPIGAASELEGRVRLVAQIARGIAHDLGNLLLPSRDRLKELDEIEAVPATLRRDVGRAGMILDHLDSIRMSWRRLVAAEAIDHEDEPITELNAWWGEVRSAMRSVLPAGSVIDANLTAEEDERTVAAPASALTRTTLGYFLDCGYGHDDPIRLTIRADEDHDADDGVRLVRIDFSATSRRFGTTDDEQPRRWSDEAIAFARRTVEVFDASVETFEDGLRARVSLPLV